MSSRLGSLFGSKEGAAEAKAKVEESPEAKAAREIHAELVGSLDLEVVQELPREDLRRQLKQTLTDRVRRRALPLTEEQQASIVEGILDEALGFGPLEPLLREDDISDILINGPHEIIVERKGKLVEVPTRFRDDAHLLTVIDRIVGLIGRRVDEASPMVDARLPDGSRFNAIIPPAAVDGPMVSIRRFGKDPIRRDDLVRFGSVPDEILTLLEGCVRSKMNIMISGGTGSGKTTLLNVLSSFIPGGERVLTIEDAAELQLQQRHVIRLETRPPNIEGKGEITARSLVRNALRMRPDRIILGEIRGGEAVDMLQAMNTGHQGSLSTIHANGSRHALARLQALVSMASMGLPEHSIREMIGDALHLVVQISRLSDGSRRVMAVTEITGMESGVITTQDVIRFRQTTVDAKGKVRGAFESTGIRPAFADRLEAHGIELGSGAFDLSIEV